MADVRRWSVTYTKQIKQKRKVYQDGFLELHSSSHKVMLYDDCDKLLHIRLLKKDDVVKSNETLAFDSYLVDIGDPHGDNKPIPILNFQGSDKKNTEKAGSLHSQEFRNNSDSVDRKPNVGKHKSLSSNLSPSQKIIRDFKKSRMNKHAASPSRPDTTKQSTTEWQVLYTTQITQKAKKFHDGFLSLAICGSQGRQVMLYDATRRLLDSRFLKKDETIRSGESLTFDSHLVDIGECEGEHKPLVDLNVQVGNYNAVGKTGIPHGQAEARDNSPIEWDAMYTTQINQKNKKYHSGILRLAFCGSYQMQVTLLTEDGSILSRKFLKLSVEVRTGITIEFPNFLVEVGEPKCSREGEAQKNASSWKDKDSNIQTSCVDKIRLSRRIATNKQSHGGEQQNNVSPGKSMDSNLKSSCIDSINLSRRVPTKNPLRDAHEILSILKKTMTQEDIVTTKRASVEECQASRSSEFVHSDIQNQAQERVRALHGKRCAVADYDEKTTTMHDCSGESLNSKAVGYDLSVEIIKSVDAASQSKTFTSSTSSLGSEISSISRSIFDVEGTDSSRASPVPPIVDLQVLDSLKLDSEDQTPPTSVSHGGSKGNVEIEDCPELMSSKDGICAAASSFSSSQFSKKVKHVNSPQVKPYADNMGNSTRWHDGASDFGNNNSSDFTSHDPCDVETKNYEASPRKMDEFPSFDLGFQ